MKASEMNDIGFERLLNAIIKQVVNDYKGELRISKRNGAYTREALRLQSWFLSDYGQTITHDCSVLILNKAEDEILKGVKLN